jgi:uncharacterized protein (TIGR03437 family)
MSHRFTFRGFLLLFTAASAMASSPTITNTSLSNGSVNSPYTANLIVTGGTPPYLFALGGALPPGLSLSSTGTIFGTPSTSSTAPWVFGVTVEDAAGVPVFATLSIRINPQGLSIATPSPLPAGIAGVEYPQKILTATGGASPYTYAITAGSLPPGMTFVKGVLGGTPTLSGSYQITVTATDSSGNRAAESLSIAISPSATGLIASVGSLSFSLSQGAGQPPSAQRVKIQSSLVLQQLTYTVAVSAAATWLNVTGGLTTPGTLSFAVTNAALSLNPATYTTTVNITCASAVCLGKALAVAVTLKVSANPAKLRVLNDVLAFAADSSALSTPLSQQLQIRNTGGLALAVTAVNCRATWCSVGSIPASVKGGVTTPVATTVNASSLLPGTYRTTVEVTTAAGSASTPVTFVVPRKPAIGLPTSGAQFTMPAGGAPATPNGSFPITATGGTLSWAAIASSTPAWLVVSTPSGTASPAQRGTVQFSINPAVASTLTTKTYYGAIQITANGVQNSPLEFRVILTVTSAQDQVRPQLEPAGVVLTTTTAKTVTATVNVFAPSATPVPWQASVSTNSGGSWLSVTPTIGNVSAATPGTSTLTANTTGLAPGVYNGTMSYALSGAAVRSVNVTLVVTAAATGSVVGPGATPHALGPKAACAPAALAIAQTGLVDDFSAPTAWPVPLAINLLNDCGATVGNAQVVATFTNGDPPLSLPLVDASSGLYAATWTPRRATSQITINTTATVPGLPVATASLGGEVVPNAEPSLDAYAILNVFNPLVGGALAPGTVVAMYGSNLASSAVASSTVPLPTQVSGTQAIIGGIPAPIYYAGPGQINAQIPFELDPSSQYQVVISNNGALTTPQSIQLAPATPGVAANPDSTIVAQHNADYSVINAAAPAQPGEYIVLYVSGMGATDTPVASGAGSPLNPLARAMPVPTVTIDSTGVPVLFAGLTPTQVGLYQINIQIPANLSNGNHQLVVSPSSGADSNSTILPVHN